MPDQCIVFKMCMSLIVEKELIKEDGEIETILEGKIPRHVAIIMDGNRRWAQKRGFISTYGHWKGADVVSNIVKLSSRLGIKVLTLYSFSTENWKRSQEETEGLMTLISSYLRSNLSFMLEESVKLETIGDLSQLPAEVQEVLRETKEKTRHGDQITLVLALNYGGRDEITRAVAQIAQDLEIGKIEKKQITESLIASYLDTASFGDPDLFIRTSGEQRVSNFLLWQLSYTEIYITDILWPDFTPDDFLDAIVEFQKRSRRLGGK